MWAPDDYVEADLLGVTEDGAIRAGADPAAYAALQIPNDPERSGPRFEGTLTEFQASHGGTEFAKEFAKNLASTGKTPTAHESDFERQALDAQLHNLVRKCAACGKACGFTTTHCNGCNAELPQETVRTDNIFMSFVYGIAKVRCVRPCPRQTSPRMSRACVHGCAGRSLSVRHRGAVADEGAAGVRRPSRAVRLPFLRDPHLLLGGGLAPATARTYGRPCAADQTGGGGVELHGRAVPLERGLVRNAPANPNPGQ